MKITDVKPFVMWGEQANRNWVFIKVETDEGVYGWGEGSLVNQTLTIADAVKQVAPQIIGQDPGNIERIWQILFLHNRYRGGVIINSALSAIDQALWDIKGKVLGVPLYQLLGGAMRDRICTYTHASDPETAKLRVQQGFDAIKTPSWPRSMETGFTERQEIKWLGDHIAGLREAVGPDVDIMIDNHGKSRPAVALKQIRAVDDLDVMFFEEPVPPDNVDALALIRQAGFKTEIATGERLLSRWGYKNVIERQLVDIIQPDVCHCGGIS